MKINKDVFPKTLTSLSEYLNREKYSNINHSNLLLFFREYGYIGVRTLNPTPEGKKYFKSFPLKSDKSPTGYITVLKITKDGWDTIKDEFDFFYETSFGIFQPNLIEEKEESEGE